MRIPRTLVNQILQQAQDSSTQEVCGLIAALDGEPRYCYPVANIAEDPAHLFRMDPQQQIAVMKAIREQGQTLFAIYHSHPDAPATPSPTDLEQAAYPEAVYLIISLDTTGVLQLAGYRLHEGDSQPVALEIYG